MVEFKRIIGVVLLILVLCIVLIPDQSTIAQNETHPLTIQGQVLDSNTLKPIPDTNITIMFIYTEIKSDKSANFSKGAKTDKQGQYIIKNISGNFLNKEKYHLYLQFDLQGSEYPNTVYSNYEAFANYSNRVNKMIFDFKLVKLNDELTICGKVGDVVDNSPLSKIKVTVKLMEGGKEKSNTLDTIECETDTDGTYKAKVLAEYGPFSHGNNSRKYAQVTINSFENIRKLNPGIEIIKAAQDIKNTINFAQCRYDFYTINSDKKGSLNGVLLDAKGTPMANVPITVNFGERNK